MFRTDRVRLASFLAVAIGILLASSSSASASGYWNSPSNICQWFGYANGPGYHAPMVLGPKDMCFGLFQHRVKRLPKAPAPPCDMCPCDESESMPEFISRGSTQDPEPQPFDPPQSLRVVRLPPVEMVGY